MSRLNSMNCTINNVLFKTFDNRDNIEYIFEIN